MNCTICGNPVHLVPSAIERSKKFGNTAAYYSGLFSCHADCLLAKRKQETIDLIKRKSHETN